MNFGFQLGPFEVYLGVNYATARRFGIERDRGEVSINLGRWVCHCADLREFNGTRRKNSYSRAAIVAFAVAISAYAGFQTIRSHTLTNVKIESWQEREVTAQM